MTQQVMLTCLDGEFLTEAINNQITNSFHVIMDGLTIAMIVLFTLSAIGLLLWKTARQNWISARIHLRNPRDSPGTIFQMFFTHSMYHLVNDHAIIHTQLSPDN
jgi:hypothetical protein